MPDALSWKKLEEQFRKHAVEHAGLRARWIWKYRRSAKTGGLSAEGYWALEGGLPASQHLFKVAAGNAAVELPSPACAEPWRLWLDLLRYEGYARKIPTRRVSWTAWKRIAEPSADLPVLPGLENESLENVFRASADLCHVRALGEVNSPLPPAASQQSGTERRNMSSILGDPRRHSSVKPSIDEANMQNSLAPPIGLGVDASEELIRAIESNRQAEQANPELLRGRLRREADLQAYYDRQRGLDRAEAIRRDKLIRSARKYAESWLSRVDSPNAMLAVTRQIWHQLVPRRLKDEESGFHFADLHDAVWKEGFPSLEERANEAIQKGSTPAITPRSKKRGRQTRFSRSQLETALAMKRSGSTNNEIAKVLYGTPTPTPERRRSVPTILKYHFNPQKCPSKKN